MFETQLQKTLDAQQLLAEVIEKKGLQGIDLSTQNEDGIIFYGHLATLIIANFLDRKKYYRDFPYFNYLRMNVIVAAQLDILEKAKFQIRYDELAHNPTLQAQILMRHFRKDKLDEELKKLYPLIKLANNHVAPADLFTGWDPERQQNIIGSGYLD